jgi:polyisoprenoid-binding protein YceI
VADGTGQQSLLRRHGHGQTGTLDRRGISDDWYPAKTRKDSMKKTSLTALLALASLLHSVHAADTYQVDPAHSTIGFSVAHLVISDVKGRFNEFAGTVEMDGNKLTAIKGTIQAKSIDTGIVKRDEHLRNADFFDVAKHPTITFASTKIETRDGKAVITGQFTLHGVTKEITAPAKVKGPITDPWGKQRVGLKATLTINRKDYGLTWNKALETGGVMVGDEVEIEINAEAVKQEPTVK